MARELIEKDNYLVYSDTGEKCDPEKNKECMKGLCRYSDLEGLGFCGKTTNPNYRKEGGKAWHCVKKFPDAGEPYWGREYIDE